MDAGMSGRRSSHFKGVDAANAVDAAIRSPPELMSCTVTGTVASEGPAVATILALTMPLLRYRLCRRRSSMSKCFIAASSTQGNDSLLLHNRRA